MQQGELDADDSPDQLELRLTGMAYEHQGKLKVYNQIYTTVFDLGWTEKELGHLRPYGEAIAAWLASNQQDESRLLRGQALVDAQRWAADKTSVSKTSSSSLPAANGICGRWRGR
ncbi:MAG: hypothetical protein HC899_37565 [Leptolyngbyaceae cyanobacterium SM1_4_3]|nr:hypothetical protein [Leptolyngbyaceae cyanobacterium SM1_4_3]